jgi:predicted phosphodiesterase
VQPLRKKLNVVVVSDTHGHYKQLDKIMQMSGDIFIHAGDFTYYGREKDFLAFFKYLEKLNFRYKVVISGNHEIVLDNGCIPPQRRAQYLAKYPCSVYHP